MSTKQKVVLGLCLVLVIALFVIAVGGGSSGQGNAKKHNGLVSWLAGLGGGTSSVSPDLVTGDCVRPDHTVVLTTTCVLRVADPGSLKLLVLRAATPFHVVAPAPGKADYTAESDVTVDDQGVAETKVAVDKASDVTVSCVGAQSCTLTIAKK